MNRIDTLDLARDQVILCILLSSIYRGGFGNFETPILSISKGPWSIGPEDIASFDRGRASWGLEMIATQNLAIALDTALELKVPNRLRHGDERLRDYFCFVRCLRNAFTHDPYRPRWVLKDAGYRRPYQLPSAWLVDLTYRHETDVAPDDYKYAGGLVRLCDFGRDIVRGSTGR